MLSEDFTPRNDIRMREEEAHNFKELPELLAKFFSLAFVIIGFMATGFGQEFSTKHPFVMTVLVLLFVLYFSLWLLGTMLGHRIQCLTKILSWIMLVIGIVLSVLVLAIANSVLAWSASLPLVGVLAVIAYYNSQELYHLFVRTVSDSFIRLIASCRGQSEGLPV